jgi:hypothetical protein
MEERWACTRAYLDNRLPKLGGIGDPPEIAAQFMDNDRYKYPDIFLNEHLAPVMERVQKCTWDTKRAVWNVSYVPHWSTNYCPYDTALCDCSTQGVTKIGEWAVLNGELCYTPRKGYEAEVVTERPTDKEVYRRAS